MGKKGKRSKKKDTFKAAVKIIEESDTRRQRVRKDFDDHMFSKCVNEIRENIRILESKPELLMYTKVMHLEACYSLMVCEYHRQNYNAALDCYNYFMRNCRHIGSLYRDAAYLFHQLIMFRLNGHECQLSDFIHYITRAGN